MPFDTDVLRTFGWNDFFAAQFRAHAEDGDSAGRVALEHKDRYQLYTEHGELLADLAGRLRHEAASREDFPAVGDWVVIRARAAERKATIHTVLPRRSKFTRKMAGRRVEEQIVGANIDTVLLVTSLNQDFNSRRVERYLTAAWDSGAAPVIILSKADLCADTAAKIAEIEAIAYGVPAHAVSAVSGKGLEALAPYFAAGQTVALLGSSGVGKSTLINHLLGRDAQRVQEIREDDGRGRHTTTHRELILLPSGGLVLDTPGMRELQLWESDEGIEAAFDDIAALAEQCYFGDCRHQDEPRCAVQQALDAGTLDLARYLNYEKLQKERAFLELKRRHGAKAAERIRWKKVIAAVKRESRWKNKR
jgi:ribosome biogenesis GTPase